MPDPFNRAKMTGDFHPPDVESDLPLEEGSANAAGTTGTPADRGPAIERGRLDRPGRAVKKAGLLRDHDDQASGRSEGHSQDSAERGKR
jgi:hypothetical protein